MGNECSVTTRTSVTDRWEISAVSVMEADKNIGMYTPCHDWQTGVKGWQIVLTNTCTPTYDKLFSQ